MAAITNSSEFDETTEEVRNHIYKVTNPYELTQEERAQTFKILNDIYKEVYHLSWGRSFKIGWKNYFKREGDTVAKVSLVASGVVIVIFAGASMTFAAFALQQAVNDIKSDGRAPIIGHFSEWTMQGVFCLSMYWQVLNEISISGEQKKAHKLFMRTLQQEDLSAEQKSIIYDDYIEYLRSRPTLSWISTRTLPKPCEIPSTLEDLLSLDQSLNEIYNDLEKQFSHLSYFQELREGWKIIASQKSACAKAGLKTAMVIGGTMLFLQLVNYSMGIVWSGWQAYEEGASRKNPSIGGHSLEWTTESLVLCNTVLYYCREIGNVGRAKILTDLFNAKIRSLREEGSFFSLKKAARLFGCMKGMVGGLPRGYFFSIPTWLMFKEEVENIV